MDLMCLGLQPPGPRAGEAGLPMGSPVAASAPRHWGASLPLSSVAQIPFRWWTREGPDYVLPLYCADWLHMPILGGLSHLRHLTPAAHPSRPEIPEAGHSGTGSASLAQGSWHAPLRPGQEMPSSGNPVFHGGTGQRDDSELKELLVHLCVLWLQGSCFGSQASPSPSAEWS